MVLNYPLMSLFKKFLILKECLTQRYFKIIRQDEIAADIYSELVKKTDPILVRSLSGIDDTSFFYQTLKQIIEDEKDMLVW